MARMITGHTGVPHITADDWANLNIGIFGDGDFYFNANNPALTDVGNRTYRLPAMHLLVQGTQMQTEGFETVQIATAGQGLHRYDYVVASYKKSSAGIESIEISTVTGVADSSNAKYPTLRTDNMRAGGTVREVALFGIHVYGSTVSVDKRFITQLNSIGVFEKAVQGAVQKVDAMPTIRVERSDPDNSVGKNGDIYLKIIEE